MARMLEQQRRQVCMLPACPATANAARRALRLLHQRRQQRIQAVCLCRQLADVAEVRDNVR
jgi:hypothetical protein